MNFDNLNKWLTLVVNVGVILSIFLLILELQQDRDLAIVGLRGERTNLTLELLEKRRSSDLVEIWHKYASREHLNEIESLKITIYFEEMLEILEYSYFQYEQGLVGEQEWQAGVQSIIPAFNDELFRSVYEANKQTYTSSFVNFLDTVIKTP